MPHRYADESLLCRDVVPGTTLARCSTDSDWTSLLARHYRSTGVCEGYETHATPDQTIVVVTRGEVDVEVFRGGAWRKGVYRSGSAGTTAGGETDRLRWRLRRGSAAFEKLHVFVPAGLIAEAMEHFRKPGRPAPAHALSTLVFNDGALANVAAALVHTMRDQAPNLYAEAAAQWMAVHLLSCRSAGSGDDDRRRPGCIADARLSRALEFISANLARPIGLEAIAAHAAVSKFHFIRLFREKMGETPIQYLAGQRLQAAARLLATSDLPVNRVASECGFVNTTHFNARFRDRFGKSPRAFRRDH